MFIASLGYAGETVFHSADDADGIRIGGSSDSDPGYLEVYGGGTDAWDVTDYSTEHPSYLKLWTGGDSPSAVYLWVAIAEGIPKLMICSGSSATGYGLPDDDGFNPESSGTVVGTQS